MSIKKFRESKQLTQEKTANILGITKEYLSMIERGDRNPSDALKEKMAILYNVTITDIFLSLKETKCFKNK